MELRNARKKALRLLVEVITFLQKKLSYFCFFFFLKNSHAGKKALVRTLESAPPSLLKTQAMTALVDRLWTHFVIPRGKDHKIVCVTN